MLPVFCRRRGWNPHTSRLLAHFNFTLNWTSKRCVIGPYQSQPAAPRYAHLYLSPGFSNFPCSCRTDNLLIKPALLGLWKELVSEMWWVTHCWCWRGRVVEYQADWLSAGLETEWQKFRNVHDACADQLAESFFTNATFTSFQICLTLSSAEQKGRSFEGCR